MWDWRSLDYGGLLLDREGGGQWNVKEILSNAKVKRPDMVGRKRKLWHTFHQPERLRCSVGGKWQGERGRVFKALLGSKRGFF